MSDADAEVADVAVSGCPCRRAEGGGDVTREEIVEAYEAAMHGIQSGVAYEIEVLGLEKAGASPKHLRVGVNSAMVTDHAIATLLIAKGIFTEEEYAEAVAKSAEMERVRIQWKHFPDGRVEFR